MQKIKACTSVFFVNGTIVLYKRTIISTLQDLKLLKDRCRVSMPLIISKGYLSTVVLALAVSLQALFI